MMNDNKVEIYDGIVKHCEAIVSGRFIMSNNAIAKLLQYVAKHEETLQFLQECTSKYDYVAEFKSAINIVGSSKFFKLPDSPHRIVALMMGLLYDIDREAIIITAFLKEYFNYGDVDDNFSQFCKQLIKPLAKAYETMCYEEEVTIEDNIDERSTRQLSEAIGEQILPFMITLSEMVMNDSGFSSQKKQEFLDMLEGMCYAIEQGSSKWLKFMWIGLKNTFTQFKLASSIINGIRSLLTTFGVISE